MNAGPALMSPEQLQTTIDRLQRMRHERVMTATPAADGSLVPLLTAGAECAAIDTCIRLLKRELQAVAS